MSGCGGGSSNTDDNISTNMEVENLSILKMTTEMDDVNLSNALIPGKETVIRVSELTNANIDIEIQTSDKTINIKPKDTSALNDTITFITPPGIKDGELWIKGNDSVSSKISFYTTTVESPYITSITADIASVGELIEIHAVNLPDSPVKVVFQGEELEVSQTVTPIDGKLSLEVPDGAVSGPVYLQLEQYISNIVPIWVKRSIDVQVNLSPGVNIDASDIGFILGLEKNSLNQNYSTTLKVEKNDLQYLHATFSQNDDNASVLYSAVVLPNMTTVTVNAKSTAIAMMFMGMGTSVVSNKDEWQSIFERVDSNSKVQDLANYISTLQKNNLSAWSDLSDDGLMTKYQDALKDVIKTSTISSEKSSTLNLQASSVPSNFVIIKQNPENGDIYVDDYVYNYYIPDFNTLNKLNDGSVNIINDTRLFMSVEARDKEEGTVINGYKHLSSGLGSLPKNSLIKPKGWAITGFSEIVNIKLDGIDANLEIVTAGFQSPATKHPKLTDELRLRVVLEGVFAPGLNMILGNIMNKPIDNKAATYNQYLKENIYKEGRFDKSEADEIFKRLSPLPKRILTAMSDIYGSGFMVQLSLKIKQGEFTNIPKEFLFDPIDAGFKDCLAGKIYKSSCENLIKGVAELAGWKPEDAVRNLLQRIATQAYDKAMKHASVLVPYVGWIMFAAYDAYEKMGDIADTATIAESLYDMENYPEQIDVDIDFPLEVSNVEPTCIGVTPTTQDITMQIFGEGFSDSGDAQSFVEIGDENESANAKDYFVNTSGDKMIVHFDAQDLIDEGSWRDYLKVGYGENFRVKYNKPITIIDQNDDEVYFDKIEPNNAYQGATVTLKGCGWLPLEDIKVWFKSEDGYLRAETSQETVDTIEAIVPEGAVSGEVFVEAGQKVTNKLFFVINSFDLTGANTDSLVYDDSVIIFNGHKLDDTDKLYFVDHEGNTIEGEILFNSDTSLRATMPEGLKHGPVRIYVQQSNGTVSNELILPLLPKGVKADPSSQDFEGSLQITLTQEEGFDIYYSIDNGEEKRYTSPLVIQSSTTLRTFARVNVDGKDYDSTEYTYVYNICGENETLINGVCTQGGPTSFTITNTDTRLNTVWAWSDNSAIAAGAYDNAANGYKIYKYDGSTWTESLASLPDHGSIRDIWGTSENNIYAVTEGNVWHDSWDYFDNGKILHYNGNSWSVLSGSPFHDGSSYRTIWGTSPTNIFAAGINGISFPYVHHYNGSTWNRQRMEDILGVNSTVMDIHGNASGNIYLVGDHFDYYDSSSILKWNGSEWIDAVKEYSFPIDYYYLHSVWVAPDNHVFVTLDPRGSGSPIVHYNPNNDTWNTFRDDFSNIYTLTSIWGNNSSDVYAAGMQYLNVEKTKLGGVLLHYDGTSWTEIPLAEDSNILALNGVSGVNTTFIVGLRYGSGGIILQVDK